MNSNNQVSDCINLQDTVKMRIYEAFKYKKMRISQYKKGIYLSITKN